MQKLILGGLNTPKEKNQIRIDVVPDWADLVWDLNDGLPKLEGEFDYIEAHNVLEHIESTRVIIGIMKDLHKYLKPGGTLSIEVPYWHSESAVESIEHCHLFNENSFMNFYSNPYAEQMKYPQYKLISNTIQDVPGHQIVRVVLTK
jgi:SAM-dependent methyltransferase